MIQGRLFIFAHEQKTTNISNLKVNQTYYLNERQYAMRFSTRSDLLYFELPFKC